MPSNRRIGLCGHCHRRFKDVDRHTRCQHPGKLTILLKPTSNERKTHISENGTTILSQPPNHRDNNA